MTPTELAAHLAAQPATFPLAHWPGRLFRLNQIASYLDDDNTPRLLVQIQLPATPLEPQGLWWDFAYVSLDDLPVSQP